MRSLVLKGGGARGYVYKSCLQELEDNGTLNDVREVGGTSAGAIASMYAAIPFPKGKRSAAIAAIDMEKGKDAVGTGWGWTIYKVITFIPHYLLSRPLSYIGKFFNWIGGGISNSIGKGAFSGLFNGLGALFGVASFLVSRDTYAAAYNLIKSGYLYHGDQIREVFRGDIQKHARSALFAYLNKKSNAERLKILDDLKGMGLISNYLLDQEGKISFLALADHLHVSTLPSSCNQVSR